MKRLRLVAHQFPYDFKSYVREPTALFFTAFLPLMFLALFIGVFGNERTPIGGGHFVRGATYYIPSILALAVISATSVNLAISIALARERGTLKRLRSTPLPPSVYLSARVVTQIVTITGIAALIVTVGRVFYDVRLPPSAWPALLVTLAVGVSAFCAVGFLLTLLIKSEQSGGAAVNAFILPLQFMSGIFFPRGSIPKWMLHIADLFPIKHLVDAMLVVFDPRHVGSRFAGHDLLILGVWGVASIAVAARYFRWTPTNR